MRWRDPYVYIRYIGFFFGGERADESYLMHGCDVPYVHTRCDVLCE